ncbi:MAG: hypothetical protein V1897_11355 [Pseudomonadota bacterium]
MSRDEKETPLSKFVTTLGRLLPKFERRELPLSRLDNARMALDGAAVSLPSNTESVHLPKLHGGIYEVALANDGTIAVVGRCHGKDQKRVLLVAEPGSNKCQEIDSAETIKRLFFPEGSNRPAYLRIRADEEAEWVWNKTAWSITLPANPADNDTWPLFWKQHGIDRGAVIYQAGLYIWNLDPRGPNSGKTVLVEPDQALGLEGFIPDHIQVVGQYLLVAWHGSHRVLSHRLTWSWDENLVTDMLDINPWSVTEGPDGRPYFLAQRTEDHNTHLFNMDGEVTMLDHKPKGVWTAPGKIFTLEEVARADADHGPTSRVHEVISGWKSKKLEDTQVEQVWLIDQDEQWIGIFSQTHGVYYTYSQTRQEFVQTVCTYETSPMIQIGNTLVFKQDKQFTSLFKGSKVLDRFRQPDHGLDLKDLIQMDDGSIQAVAKNGTAVITYKFYDPNV